MHGEDVDRLLAVLRRFVDRGDTVLVIEHHLDLVARCDHLIDLGPGGGAGGGQVVVAGGVREVAACAASHAGAALRALYGGALPPAPHRVQPSRTHA